MIFDEYANNVENGYSNDIFLQISTLFAGRWKRRHLIHPYGLSFIKGMFAPFFKKGSGSARARPSYG
jgi:hypothetical protein